MTAILAQRCVEPDGHDLAPRFRDIVAWGEPSVDETLDRTLYALKGLLEPG
ncbi:MAG: hypothetical protein NVSMB4_03840 [Acidimicrobiales bacterium]